MRALTLACAFGIVPRERASVATTVSMHGMLLISSTLFEQLGVGRASTAMASDFHASDGMLAHPYENDEDTRRRWALSREETKTSRRTAARERVDGETLRERARATLSSLERRYELAAETATTVKAKTRAMEDASVMRAAIWGGREETTGVTKRRVAALGSSGAFEEDAWAASGGLKESVEAHGGSFPGVETRSREVSRDVKIDDGAAVKRFYDAKRRKKPVGAEAKKRAARFSSILPSWLKPRAQPEVYWDVDLEKIQLARAKVEASREAKDDFEFEITDMPIKKKWRTAAKFPQLGASLATPASEEKDQLDNQSGDDLVALSPSKRDGVSIMDDNNAIFDEEFTKQVEAWTSRTMDRIYNVTASARETMKRISAEAKEAEENALMKHIPVTMYVDFADPNSLDLILGAYQRLASMSLGPIEWNVVPFVNVGQAQNTSVNCGHHGHSRHLSCTANAVAACAVDNVGTMVGGMQAFSACYAVQILRLEAHDAFKYGRHEQSLVNVETRCCAAVAESVEKESKHSGSSSSALSSSSLFGSSTDRATERTGKEICEAQNQCAFGGKGFDLLRKNGAKLGALEPQHSWLPWVTVDGHAVCMGKCNLQAAIRERVCFIRTRLPDDCPKFPWAQAWYDEPEISFGGLIAASAAVILVVTSLFVLAREAGLRPLGLFKGDKPKLNGERDQLLPK